MERTLLRLVVAFRLEALPRLCRCVKTPQVLALTRERAHVLSTTAAP